MPKPRNIPGVKQSLKHAELGKLSQRYPPPAKIRDIKLPVTDSGKRPFTATEEMAYSSIFGTYSKRQKQTSHSVQSHEESLYGRLSRELNSGLYQSGIPFPERSPPGMRTEKTLKFLEQGVFQLIFRHDEKIDSKIIYSRYQQKTKKLGVRCGINWCRGRELKASLWGLGQRDGGSVFDFWTSAENIIHRTAISEKLGDDQGYLIFGIVEDLKTDQIKKLLDESKDELEIISAVLQSDLIGGSEGLDKVVAKLSTPWKLREEEEKQLILPDVLNELAKYQLSHGSLGPGDRLYIT